ncbi:phosphopantetheine-binding protein [Paenibacillus thiaminolyticus]
MELERLPLTPNGKIDRKALPAPEGEAGSGTEYVAPRNELETKLAAIWQEVLGLAKEIGVHDNFFDIGGHSLRDNGGTMVIVPKDDRIDPSRLHYWISQQQVTIFESTPALLVPFLEYVHEQRLDMSGMELLITSSDSCSVADYRTLQDASERRTRNETSRIHIYLRAGILRSSNSLKRNERIARILCV